MRERAGRRPTATEPNFFRFRFRFRFKFEVKKKKIEPPKLSPGRLSTARPGHTGQTRNTGLAPVRLQFQIQIGRNRPLAWVRPGSGYFTGLETALESQETRPALVWSGLALVWSGLARLGRWLAKSPGTCLSH